MNEKARDRMSSLVCFGLAVIICIGSVKISVGNLRDPGPGFFSFLSGTIFGLLSAAVFLQSLKGPSRGKQEVFWANPQKGLKVIYTLAAIALYAIGMNYLGYFFSTLAFLGFLTKCVDPQPWPVVLAASILGAIGSSGIFQYWFNVQFPVGIFGF